MARPRAADSDQPRASAARTSGATVAERVCSTPPAVSSQPIGLRGRCHASRSPLSEPASPMAQLVTT